MQKPVELKPHTQITPIASITLAAHGGRAKCLQRLMRMDLPVPCTVALSFEDVRRIASGEVADLGPLLDSLGRDRLMSVRPSGEVADWGGPGAILNIGMNDAQHARLTKLIGAAAADVLYIRFIQSYAVHVARLDPDMFDMSKPCGIETIRALLNHYEGELDEPFPQDPEHQLCHVLRSMARAWEGTSARLLRQAKGAPAEAGLGLVVQVMALGVGAGQRGEFGSGVIQFVSGTTGQPQITGRYLSQSQGREALVAGTGALYLTCDARGPSLQDICPDIFQQLQVFGESCRLHLREEMQIEFTLEAGKLYVLDAVRVPRNARAAVRIAVALARDGIIPKAEAVLRVDPTALSDLLHPQVDPDGPRDSFAHGIAASPGAATGRLVFTARAAQASAAREEPCVLVRRETKPDDVRGMLAAAAVLTERGGATSHAAVIARGLGLPCVVGASGIKVDAKARILIGDHGRVFHEGDIVTVDGTRGVALVGAARLLEPALDDAFQSLLGWADSLRDIGVRANADTRAEAEMARRFAAEGIGLCRTEHMFFDSDRLTVMREMIFAERPEDRAAALERLLPVQRSDFKELFQIMAGLPVCIRLLDPPLHEFLPEGREGMLELADALNLPMAKVVARVESLREVNPMLGMRGVRLGIAVPEIYDMQARAIFEAAVAVGGAVVPEVMIPLVSARREVELIKSRVDAVAAAVRAESGVAFAYRLGVMVETPRAALRAGEIAETVSFLSFGTNDLTQYLLAIDRNNEKVSEGFDSLHPAVLQAVRATIDGAKAEGKPVHICGEMAADPFGAALLVAMEVDALSMNSNSLPRVRQMIRAISLMEAKQLLAIALLKENASEVRLYMQQQFERLKLGALIRAGG